jgi:hypothetical protein
MKKSKLRRHVSELSIKVAEGWADISARDSEIARLEALILQLSYDNKNLQAKVVGLESTLATYHLEAPDPKPVEAWKNRPAYRGKDDVTGELSPETEAAMARMIQLGKEIHSQSIQVTVSEEERVVVAALQQIADSTSGSLCADQGLVDIASEALVKYDAIRSGDL